VIPLAQRAPTWLARALLALATALAILVASASAWAFVPPPHTGLVTDTSGSLREEDRQTLGRKLDAYRRGSGNTVAVLVIAGLDGEAIDDVAYETFRAWGIGKKGADTGVLLVIAMADHAVRIETGKGAGGNLTDLQANDIIRQKISPRLREGRVREAIADGTDAIEAAMGGASAPLPTKRGVPPAAGSRKLGCGGMVGIFVLVVIAVIIWTALARRGIVILPMGMGGGVGGGGRRDDDDDGGFGGGESGGGGSSDRW
jgi:uncharacterized protein